MKVTKLDNLVRFKQLSPGDVFELAVNKPDPSMMAMRIVTVTTVVGSYDAVNLTTGGLFSVYDEDLVRPYDVALEAVQRLPEHTQA